MIVAHFENFLEVDDQARIIGWNVGCILSISSRDLPTDAAQNQTNAAAVAGRTWMDKTEIIMAPERSCVLFPY